MIFSIKIAFHLKRDKTECLLFPLNVAIYSEKRVDDDDEDIAAGTTMGLKSGVMHM